MVSLISSSVEFADVLSFRLSPTSHQFFMSGRHGRRTSSGGGWGDEPRTRRGDIKFILLVSISLISRASNRPLPARSRLLQLHKSRCNPRHLIPVALWLSKL